MPNSVFALMKRLVMLMVAAVSATLALDISAGYSLAQTDTQQSTEKRQSTSKSAAAICNGTLPIEAESLVEVFGTTISPNVCNLSGRTITDNGVGVLVPPPSEGAGVASVAGESGEGQEFAVETDKDGTIHLLFVGSKVAGVDVKDSTAIQPMASSPPACQDGAFDYSRRESDTHRWRYNGSTTDGSLSRDEALSGIRQGVNNILTANNNCGYKVYRYGPSAEYVGGTDRRANMSGTNCGSRDQVNVVDFGSIDGKNGTLAYTCYWYFPVNSEVEETDTRFDTAESWTVLPDSSCSGQWDLAATATHEWGHTFGMNHVSEDNHGNLTMSPLINGTCQGSERTLGRGDYIGLMNDYGGAQP